jgi:hypothetical protein
LARRRMFSRVFCNIRNTYTRYMYIANGRRVPFWRSRATSMQFAASSPKLSFEAAEISDSLPELASEEDLKNYLEDL